MRSSKPIGFLMTLAATGAKLWSFPTGSQVFSNPAWPAGWSTSAPSMATCTRSTWQAGSPRRPARAAAACTPTTACGSGGRAIRWQGRGHARGAVHPGRSPRFAPDSGGPLSRAR
jgi:hypothetical protein